MRKSRLLPLFMILIASTLILPAFALTWYAPTYPFYASLNQHGAIYFNQGFTATNGSWIGGLLAFTDFNYAGTGAFADTVGFAASNDTEMTLLEAIPTDHLLFQTSSVGALRNVTLWLPGNNVVNVTNAQAWNWDNSTYLLHITTPLGLANIHISFIAGGGMPTIFFIPQWFVNQGGAFFGITGFFAQLMSVMTAFVAWFILAIGNIVTLIFWIMTAVTGVAGTVIWWFSNFILFWSTLLGFINDIFHGAGAATGIIDIWTEFNISAIAYFIVVLGCIGWIDSIPKRAKKGGRNVFEVIIGDLQIMFYLVEQVWNWSWLVFNFVYGVVMQFVSLLWNLIP